MTLLQAKRILKATPDYGRSLERQSPFGIVGEAATIWAAQEHLRRTAP